MVKATSILVKHNLLFAYIYIFFQLSKCNKMKRNALITMKCHQMYSRKKCRWHYDWETQILDHILTDVTMVFRYGQFSFLQHTLKSSPIKYPWAIMHLMTNYCNIAWEWGFQNIWIRLVHGIVCNLSITQNILQLLELL